jgi:phenylpropionate dioxygenase-like ring-hydroxylating dioxygenase large terminal subunit
MGAYLKIQERRLEKKLAADATRGPRPPSREFYLGHDEADGAETATDGRRVADRRKLIPPLGLREYWYPAVELSRISSSKPLYWRMLGEELVLFRSGDGVGALTDVCPHRGASLSQGKSLFKDTVSCPYHGATFDAGGECRAFITEGYESRMPGQLRAKSYPTRVLRGWVFVWMGEGEPAPIEEDVPPEFFADKNTVIMSDYTYWDSSWIIAIENQNDSHNQLFVHRNSLYQLKRRGRERTPVGPRCKVVNDRAVYGLGQNQTHYLAEDGTLPYKMHYPGVEGTWPRTNVRKALWWLFTPWNKYVVYSGWRKRLSRLPYQEVEEWGGGQTRGGGGWHLPSMVRINFGLFVYTRYVVPVSETTSRVIYWNTRRTRSVLTRAVLRVWFRGYFNYFLHYNFSGQDMRAAAPCRYWTEETLAPTDSQMVMLRKLITEKSRDAVRLKKLRAPVEASNESAMFELSEKTGIDVQRSVEEAQHTHDSADDRAAAASDLGI